MKEKCWVEGGVTHFSIHSWVGRWHMLERELLSDFPDKACQLNWILDFENIEVYDLFGKF